MKLGPRGVKTLKVVHLGATVLWMGGVLSWLPLVFSFASATSYSAQHVTYEHFRLIAFNVIGWGGMTSFLSGLAISFLSSWGLLKYRWTMAKLVLTLCGVAFGMFFVEVRMVRGLEMMEALGERAFNSPALLANHRELTVGVLIEVVMFLAIVSIAVFKPWIRRGARTPEIAVGAQRV
jgi:hypothetical protein